ncbi:MAG: kanF [Bacteroidota bacterium]|jgi:glycosyltransferase involved in cell wall biosynthesis|nr:kanF [Bacteroidota bacterium]
MSNIAILLNGDIINDSRVIRIIRTFSKDPKNNIDLFYIDGTDSDKKLFSENVRLYSIQRDINFKTQVIRHSFFYNEFMFFIKEVLSTKINYDYIYANDLPCLKPAVKLKKLLCAKVIYDSHEIYLETINQFFPVRSSGIKKYIFKFLISFMRNAGEIAEKKLLQDVDSFITVGLGLKLYFEKKYKTKNIQVLMNFPSRPTSNKRVDIHAILHLDRSDFIVLYQGVLNLGRGLFTMIESMKYTKANIKLVVLGYGTLKNTLQEFVVSENLSDKVFFMEKVDSSVLLEYTRSANCGISLLEPFNLSCKFAAPNKLFEYINSSLPVIATNTFESNLVFKKYEVGLLVENEPINIAKAMDKLSESNLSPYIENCNEAAKEYHWENQENILFNLVK